MSNMLKSKLNMELVQDNILSQADNNVEYCSENCQDFSEALAEQREKLEDAEVSSLRMVAIYLLLLEKARVAPKEMLSKELRNPANKKILPQLLDVMAGAQTPDAHQAAMETLNFRSTFSIDLPERYLWALSLAPHPPEEVLRDVLRRWRSQEIPDARLKQTLVLALGALGKHFAAFADNAHKQVVKEIHKAIWDALDACKDEPCKVVLLRAVRNLGATGDVEMLLDHVVHGERKTAVVAMKALRSLPLEALRGEGVRAVLEEVYFQAGRRYDSTARTIAGDLLVELYPRDVAMVEAMFRGLQDLQSYEVNTFVLGRLRDLATRDEGTRELLRRYEARTDYHRLAQGGKSTYFTRDFYRDVPDGSNSTFSSGLEISAGLLKLVTFDAHMQNSLGSLDYLQPNEPSDVCRQVALYTAGLHTYSSKEPDPEDLNDVATAGMELSLLGTQLRPFVFFEGQGELMGHIWSGTASTRTPAIQGTYILHDHVESIPLSNGLLGRITFTGSVSLDLGGQIQTSLWYKTCHFQRRHQSSGTQLQLGGNTFRWLTMSPTDLDAFQMSPSKKIAGVVIRGRVSADTPFVQSKIEVTLAAQPQLDIVSDMDFSEKTMMCLQMSQPDFVLKHTVRKAEHIIGQQHRLRKIARRTRPVPGCTYLMNKKGRDGAVPVGDPAAALRLLRGAGGAHGAHMVGDGVHSHPCHSGDQKRTIRLRTGDVHPARSRGVDPAVQRAPRTDHVHGFGLPGPGRSDSDQSLVQDLSILHDHVESIPLSNGLLGRITFTGSVSLDLGGQIQTSLWYKTCHSNVDTRAGVVIRGRVSADTPFVQSKIEVTLAAQPQLDIVSDMDFSEKTMMCLQMSQPDFVLKHTVRKAEHIIGQQHRLRKIARRTRPVPGCTYLMNKKNSKFCNIMFKDKS
ncbi:unnamed protein product [Darwinula stevensoni]|uniref:MTP large subunit lipid-binding domain-containing protein n=1 Tax=Darwinula stevensoni TaxID=69355 RepID=A0A7R9AC54_9CRUS|nr:unnamed protein product [Darwinula stevensoni]CAG0899879.1 unnamed protein product [Darwinula stevensoni]